jgi:hypothetical protein
MAAGLNRHLTGFCKLGFTFPFPGKGKIMAWVKTYFRSGSAAAPRLAGPGSPLWRIVINHIAILFPERYWGDTSLEKVVEDRRRSRRFAFTNAINNRASVLDSASPLALWSGPSKGRPRPHKALGLFKKCSGGERRGGRFFQFPSFFWNTVPVAGNVLQSKTSRYFPSRHRSFAKSAAH